MSSSTMQSKVVIAAGAAFAIAIPLTYYYQKLTNMHRDLAATTMHQSSSGNEEVLVRNGKGIHTISEDVLKSSAEYVVVCDRATKIVSASALPAWDVQKLLTTYARHNMCKFAQMPQAWILWLMADASGKKTFGQQHISSLNFDAGDRICESYVVRHRDPGQIELGMSLGAPGHIDYIDGRLVLSLQIEEGRAIFETQTFMWRKKASSKLMPLERPLPTWGHELASWSLIEHGIQHIQQLRQQQDLENRTR